MRLIMYSLPRTGSTVLATAMQTFGLELFHTERTSHFSDHLVQKSDYTQYEFEDLTEIFDFFYRQYRGFKVISDQIAPNQAFLQALETIDVMLVPERNMADTICSYQAATQSGIWHRVNNRVRPFVVTQEQINYFYDRFYRPYRIILNSFPNKIVKLNAEDWDGSMTLLSQYAPVDPKPKVERSITENYSALCLNYDEVVHGTTKLL